MDKMGKPTKAEIAENRRRLALDYAIRVPGTNVAGVITVAKAIEKYLAGRSK